MRTKVEIVRRESKDTASYLESFYVEIKPDTSIMMILKEINHQNRGRPIDYEQSCNQKQCGSCAMVINGVPGLACGTFVRDVLKQSEQDAQEPCIRIEPLSKFPVIRDLRVDRSAMYEAMSEMKLWVESIKDEQKYAEYHQMLYESASCLMCGCCLEVCPNYYAGGRFFGANAMHVADRMLIMESDAQRNREMKKLSRIHGSNHCSKSLGCEKVCPAKLPLTLHISNLSKKVIF